MSKLHLITFSAVGIGTVTVMPDETPVYASGGYGGWTTVPRERRKALTVWQGIDPIQLSAPILFDGYADGTSQEANISRLSRMALPPTTGGEPPTLRISGHGVPNYGPKNWVIQNIAWGTEKVIFDFAANGVYGRLRQDAVVTLLEYRGEDRAAFKGLDPSHGKAQTGPSKSGWPKTYYVKQGDTLRKIAAMTQFYGDANLWKKIADANNVRDPSIIPNSAGLKLRIPAP